MHKSTQIKITLKYSIFLSIFELSRVQVWRPRLKLDSTRIWVSNSKYFYFFLFFSSLNVHKKLSFYELFWVLIAISSRVLLQMLVVVLFNTWKFQLKLKKLKNFKDFQFCLKCSCVSSNFLAFSSFTRIHS